MSLAPRSVALVVEGAVLATLTILSVLVQVQRLAQNHVRLDTSRWLLLAGAILAQIMTGLVMAMAILGLGKKMSAQDLANHTAIQSLLFAAFVAYLLCNMIIKLSWLTFFYGLTCKRRETYLIHGMQAVAIAFGLSSIAVVLIFYGMQAAQRPFHGVDILDFWYFNSVFMIVTDTMMYVIPIWLLYHNTTIRGHQSGVYILFALGGIVVVASIMRLSAVNDLAHSGNPSGTYAMIWFWSALENHLGICVACAGALKQQVTALMARIRRSIACLPEAPATATDEKGRTSSGWAALWPCCGIAGLCCCWCTRAKPPRLIVYKSQTTCVTSAPRLGSTKMMLSSTNASSVSEGGIQCWFDAGDITVLFED